VSGKGGLLAIEIGTGKARKRMPSTEEIDLDEEGEDDSAPTDDEIDQAQSLIDAIEAKDAAGVVVAFKALDAVCESGMKELADATYRCAVDSEHPDQAKGEHGELTVRH